MRIVDVATAAIEANFRWKLIRVTADNGLVGIGEAYWGPGVLDIVDAVRPLLLGQDPMDVERLWTRLLYGQLDTGARPVRPVAGGLYATAPAIACSEIPNMC